MRHALHPGTDLVLALDDQRPVRFQDSLRLGGSTNIEFEHCVMPLAVQVRRAVSIRVVVAE
jgi:hypothetical protein